jgi:hypothetical protein
MMGCFYQFQALFALGKRYEVKIFDFKVVRKPSKCVLWPSMLRIVKTQLLCPSKPNKGPRTKHTKTYEKVRAIFVKTSARGSGKRLFDGPSRKYGVVSIDGCSDAIRRCADYNDVLSCALLCL